MILYRLEAIGWDANFRWRELCEAASFHHVNSPDALREERAKGDLLLEFRNRRRGFYQGRWTTYRLYFEPHEVIRLEHVLEITALDGLKKYGDRD